jgi:geranylgeranyl diphosphate synthase type I
MSLYEDAIQMLLNLPESARWDELRHALERALNHRPVAWHFPVKACEAVGGQSANVIPAVAAITCAHMAIMLVDDILDDDPRGAYRHLGVGKTANLAVGLNSLGLSVLMAGSSGSNGLHAAQELNEMMQTTAYGQDLDVMNVHTEESYWAVTRSKSSPYFGAALYLGALFGGASLDLAKQLKQFGELYGEIMQIHDDLNDSLAVPANVDWLAGRSPLPLLFAQLVDHPEREWFVELRSKVEDPIALEEAQSILVRCGAISYSVNELLRRHGQATELLKKIQLANPMALMQLLEEAIAPVRYLFAKVGADLGAAF